MVVAGRQVAHARAGGRDVLGPHAAAAADDLGALLAPGCGELGVLVAADALVEAPAVGRVVAEVGVDAERQVGEVPQPGQHPGTWSGGRQLISSALTPISSKRRAMRPNSSPSGPPQCWPKTPHTPCRQRRKLTHTGIPDPTSASIAPSVSPSRISVIVSSRTRSGGSSSNARGSSSSSSRRGSESTSPLMLNASAVFPLAARVGDRLTPDAEPAPGDVHPVQRRRVRGIAPAVHLAAHAPRVRGDHVAAGLDVAGVHGLDRVRVAHQRPRAPQGLLVCPLRGGHVPSELVPIAPSSITQRSAASSSSTRP